MMKTLTILISCITLLCLTSKTTAQTNQLEKEKSTTKNPFIELCKCKNSKGLTIDEFAKLESKKQNQTIDEVIQQMNFTEKENNWVYTEYLFDQTFMTNFKSTTKDLMSEAGTTTKSKEAGTRMIAEVEKEQPACWKFIRYLLPVLVH